MGALLAGTAMLWAAQGEARQADEDDDARRAIVVTAPGGAIDIDDALSLSSADIARGGTPDLLSALTRSFAGVSLQDAQGNPWQPNLVYRGFTASPLQGQAQGIAVYLDGARFNQPFGDTVAFDLLPEAAVADVKLLDASPVYGLNALGGAMVVSTKTGRSDPGLEASYTGGRFDYHEASIAGGFAKGDWNAYGAFQYSHDGGWRAHSPSTLYNGYLDVGFDAASGGLHLKLIGADTDLTGNGVAPVELMRANRSAVFTWPDNSKAKYARVSLHPWVRLTDPTRIEGTLYAQRLTLRTINGDAADIEACNDGSGVLCLTAVGDDAAQSILTDAGNSAIADMLDGGHYGVLNRGRTRTDAMGALFQIIDERPLPAGDNHLALGMSYDNSRTRFGTSVELGALTDDRSVDGLGSFIVQSDGAITPVGLVARADYLGVFVQDRLPIAPGLSAEIGLRYNHARIVLRDQIGAALNGRHGYNRLNPGIELDYVASEGLSLRAGYAQSNRAPTPAELSCADEDAPCSLTNFFIADPALKQVVAKSWELGASGQAEAGGARVQWLLSAWRTRDRDDIQYVASAVRGRAYFRNIGSTRRQGVEASVKAVRGGFTASLSYAFTDATYRAPLTLSSPANPDAGDEGTIAVARGDRLPGIPRHSATLSLNYAAGDWSVGGDILARSGQYLVGDEGNDNAKLPGYSVVNLRASVRIIRGVSLFGELRNAFDRHYATFGTFSDVGEVALAEAPDASDPRAYGPGSPRRWYVGVKAVF
ncbi:TonB-dependent receptor [Sphingobium sp. OAS761]|uniref:TonB-dependent receptor n=1 Tax=Sphingobium sp. OAS761 TaxID=2817901 RepID=UPI00209CE6AF|nr:TonB-dependent receptor [Sphingobium sp. OAS761]